MGTVYAAEHLLMRRRVALKVLPTSRVEDASHLQRFYLEAMAAAALDHPNIVRVYDMNSDGNTHFLVMEYVEGLSLQKLVRSRGTPLDCDTAADFVQHAARGLAHTRAAGLVHRDVKPGNLLVDQSGTLRILDMGLARFESHEDESPTLGAEPKVLGTAAIWPRSRRLIATTSMRGQQAARCTFCSQGIHPFPRVRWRSVSRNTSPAVHLSCMDCAQTATENFQRFATK